MDLMIYTLGYVSRDSSLIIGQLERIKLFYLYKCHRIENAIINTFSPIVVETRFYRSDVKVTMTCVKWRQNVRQFPCGFLRAGNHISGRLYEILFIWFLSEIE